MLWTDKYRPTQLKEIESHTDIACRLGRLAESHNMPHLLFYGPSGAGKRTLISCFLRALFGPSSDSLTSVTREYTVNSTPISIPMLSSPHHIEVNVSSAASKDRIIVQELVKELSENKDVTVAEGKGYKFLVLDDADKLSPDSQHALRRTMEIYSSSCKFILVTTSLSRIIEPLRSRCMCVRVPVIEKDTAMRILNRISEKEGLNVVPTYNANFRVAMLSLQACATAQKDALEPEWILVIRDIAQKVSHEPYAKTILECRKSLFSLLSNCIPPDIIILRLLDELRGMVNDVQFFESVFWAGVASERIYRGSHPIMHLEMLISKIMANNPGMGL